LGLGLRMCPRFVVNVVEELFGLGSGIGLGLGLRLGLGLGLGLGLDLGFKVRV
jgi:hypothetical protein